MPILFQVTTPMWLSLPVETREKLRIQFKIPRTGQRSFVQMNGRGEVTSDGTTNADLSALSLQAMAKYLGLVEVPGEDMLLTLFKKVVERVEWTGESPEADEKALSENPVPENFVNDDGKLDVSEVPKPDDGTTVVTLSTEQQIVNGTFNQAQDNAALSVMPPVIEKPLDKMNKQELLAKAKSLELDVPEEMTKAQIVEAIKAISNT